MKDQTVLRTFILVALSIIAALLGLIWADLRGDIQELKADVKQVQREYATIGVVQQRAAALEQGQLRLEARLDAILEAVSRR